MGGDGTMRGAMKIFEEVRRRKLRICIAGIPKTVDNDVGIIDRSCEFYMGVETTQSTIDVAHVDK